MSATTSSFAVTLAKKAAQERLDALQKDSYNATNFFAYTKRARDDGADDEDGQWHMLATIDCYLLFGYIRLFVVIGEFY